MFTDLSPSLTLLIFLPLLGGVAVLMGRTSRQASLLALGLSLLEFLLSLIVVAYFDSSSPDMQFVERYAWITSLNIDYAVGIDGISVLFVPLTALLTSCGILASWKNVQGFVRLHYALLLFLESFTLGVYCALDLGLFFFFWELTLVPLFFLISLFGIGPKRRYAAIKYTLMMLAGGVALLLGILLLAQNHASATGLGLSFDYASLLKTPVPPVLQSTIFLLLFWGFAVKAPLFPFHVWLPTVAMEGPSAVSTLLMGLKLGLFGILRFAIPLVPQAAHHYTGLMAMLGITGVIYGSIIALKQTNLRRMLAYSSVSHVGLVLIGISAMNQQGLQGACLQLFNFGVLGGGIFLLAGFIKQRFGSTEQVNLGGLSRSMPLLSGFFFILGLGGMGVPGTSGFAAENLIVVGAFRDHAGIGIATLCGAILGAAYFLGFFRRAFLGPSRPEHLGMSWDLRPRETLIAGLLVSLTLSGGIVPQPFLHISQASLERWLSQTEQASVGVAMQ